MTTVFEVWYKFWTAVAPSGLLGVASTEELAKDAISTLLQLWNTPAKQHYQPDGFEVRPLTVNSFPTPRGGVVVVGDLGPILRSMDAPELDRQPPGPARPCPGPAGPGGDCRRPAPAPRGGGGSPGPGV